MPLILLNPITQDMEESKSKKLMDELLTQGYTIFPQFYKKILTEQLKVSLNQALEEEKKYEGLPLYKSGVVSLCPYYDEIFLEILKKSDWLGIIDSILGEDSHLWIYMSSTLPPHGTNYSNRIHRDNPRFLKNYVEGIGCLITLDEFTIQNGATTVYPGSHLTADLPSETEYSDGCAYLECPPGSVILFDGRLVHRGEINRTNTPRHALALGFYRSYIKQRLNIPVILDSRYNSKDWDEYVRTKLGYYSQSPVSMAEFVARGKKNY